MWAVRQGLLGLDLFVQHAPQMLDWHDICGIWSPTQHLRLVPVVPVCATQRRHLLPLLHHPVLMLRCPLVTLVAVDGGQRGHPYCCAAPCATNCDTLCVLTRFYQNQHQPFHQCELQSVTRWTGTNRSVFAPCWLTPSFLRSTLIDIDQCRLGTSHRSCRFRDAVTQS